MDNDSKNLGDSSPLDEQPMPSTKTAPSKRQFCSETIGPYKTLEILGEGGMGVVYRAQQTKPVKREVALKLIKLGMDTKQVIARFESERQALALMDHPNVAKVFDAGATEQGRPYFVMELVHGLPITEHCDRHRLSIDQRLDLFMKTCEAIQHAHQKGIIHRDIKPSNILVEYRDGQATPKIIDFGVAKATSQRLTEKTLFTEQGQMVGTPAYMSPEQADLSTQDIDTRSDIYSLGVLLYELLIGTLPFDAKSLRNAGFAEIQRIIRDEEPQKPSTRISSGGFVSSDQEDVADFSSLGAAAKKRRSDPRTLIKRIRGDLDWIVMKCLEKDRARRYETANSLVSDIRRHLSNEPVLASPPGSGYRFKKFIRRNKGPVTAVAAVLIALAAGLALAVHLYVRAENARVQAENARAETAIQRDRANHVQRFLVDLFRSSDPNYAKGSTITAQQLLDEGLKKIDQKLQDQPNVRATLLNVMGTVYNGLGLYDTAEKVLRKALRIRRSNMNVDQSAVAETLDNLGDVLFRKGDYDETLRVNRELLEILQRTRGPEHPSTRLVEAAIAQVLQERESDDVDLVTMNMSLGFVLTVVNPTDFDPEIATVIIETRRLNTEEGRQAALRFVTEYHRKTIARARNLVLRGRKDDAKKLVRKHFYPLLNNVFLKDMMPAMLSANAQYLQQRGNSVVAMCFLEEAVTLAREIWGDDHPSTLGSINNMGGLLEAMGKYNEAVPYNREALQSRRRVLGDDHRDTLTSINNMGGLLEAMGKYEEALPYYREALEGRRRVLGDDHPDTHGSIHKMGGLMRHLGRFEEAEVLGAEAVRRSRTVLPDGHLHIGIFLGGLGKTLLQLERFEEAETALLEAHGILETARRAKHERTIKIIKSLIDLYESWHAAEPNKGYDEKAAEWRAKLPKAHESGPKNP